LEVSIGSVSIWLEKAISFIVEIGTLLRVKGDSINKHNRITGVIGSSQENRTWYGHLICDLPNRRQQ
jgi:hypothetical protein